MRHKFRSLEMNIRQMLQPEWADEVDLVDLNSEDCKIPLAKGKSIGLGAQLTAAEVIEKALRTELTQIIQKDCLETNQEVRSSAKMLFDGKDFVNFPISSILSPDSISDQVESNLRKYSLVFSRSDQKQQMLDDLAIYVSSIMKRKSMVEEVLSVADEIYSNAIFNAPFVNVANHRGVNRSDGVVESDKEALLVAGDNGTRLAMAVIDRYGSLKVQRLLKQIQNTYENGAGNTIQLSGDGGAGLGTFMVFESCLSMYLIVKPGEYTIFGVTMPLTMNRREKHSSPKNLHFLELD